MPVANEYIIFMKGGAANVRWEHKFYIHSDEMAIDYAKRCLEHDKASRDCMGYELFNITDNCFLASFVLNDPSARRSDI
jgi:hypothetical protein